ncbi:hypothetical protein [Zooshikella sp. RANM57]|uniref:hypothetical protein n=1 Tax=Zooshikella sp. RANM57 TaxID=3425863 RepID=UPI003D6DAFA1
MIFKVLLIVTASALLAGCPALLKLSLKNETENEIHLYSIYSGGVLTTIKPGETGSIPYTYDCLKVGIEDSIVEYKEIVTTSSLIRENGIFSTKIDVVINKDKIVFLKEKDDGKTVILDPKCD